MVTLYSTPTCAPCRAAEARLEDAGIEVRKIDLTQDPELVEVLKERLDTKTLQTPIFEIEGDLFNITDLPNILRSVN